MSGGFLLALGSFAGFFLSFIILFFAEYSTRKRIEAEKYHWEHLALATPMFGYRAATNAAAFAPKAFAETPQFFERRRMLFKTSFVIFGLSIVCLIAKLAGL